MTSVAGVENFSLPFADKYFLPKDYIKERSQ